MLQAYLRVGHYTMTSGCLSWSCRCRRFITFNISYIPFFIVVSGQVSLVVGKVDEPVTFPTPTDHRGSVANEPKCGFIRKICCQMTQIPFSNSQLFGRQILCPHFPRTSVFSCIPASGMGGDKTQISWLSYRTACDVRRRTSSYVVRSCVHQTADSI